MASSAAETGGRWGGGEAMHDVPTKREDDFLDGQFLETSGLGGLRMSGSGLRYVGMSGQEVGRGVDT